MFENEKCWIILGKRRGKFWHGRLINETEGEPAKVDFDGDYVLRREESHNDVLGWIHLHPHMSAIPSNTDDITMESWATCFGKPLICGIRGNEGLRLYLYFSDGTYVRLRRFIKVGSRLLGINWNDNIQRNALPSNDKLTKSFKEQYDEKQIPS